MNTNYILNLISALNIELKHILLIAALVVLIIIILVISTKGKKDKKQDIIQNINKKETIAEKPIKQTPQRKETSSKKEVVEKEQSAINKPIQPLQPVVPVEEKKVETPKKEEAKEANVVEPKEPKIKLEEEAKLEEKASKADKSEKQNIEIKEPETEVERAVEKEPETKAERAVEKEPIKKESKTASPKKVVQDSSEADNKKYFGKFEIDVTAAGYHFYLLANNGQLLYSSCGFTTPEGATKGIETFKKSVEQGDFIVDEDKFGRYRFILNRRYAGENFNTKLACENNIESVKKFTKTAMIMEYEPNPEGEKEYKKFKSKLQVKDCDWEKIKEEEANTKPSGKFEVSKHSDGFRYELIANNGQLLYSSNGYASNKSAKEAINNFKKAAYCGTFLIDEDKFGRFRFILRGATVRSTYIGESYTTKAACERSINSVKNFVKSAVLPD